jgi:hypothetical protein
MINENLKGSEIDYSFVANHIPQVMNAMYNEDVAKPLTLFEIRDAFRVKQMQSKAWLVSKLTHIDKSKKVLVVGSWLGFTSLCLNKLGFSEITEIDVDPRLEDFSKHLNRFNKKFKHITDDINNIDISEYELIINTSCEHILENSWFDKIAKDTIIVLHSNNLPGYDHVNTCESIGEMIEKYPMQLQYSGSLDFTDWKRFMLIGTKCK